MKLSQRQQEIVNSSIQLIADRGIQNLTIKNLSNAVGISEAAIYRHFNTKFDIVAAVLDTFSIMASSVLDSLEIEKYSPLEKIEYFMTDRLRRCAENPELAKVMMSEENFQGDKVLSERMLQMMHQHKERIECFISEGILKGEIRNDIDSTTMFRIIFGPMRLLIKQWCLSGYRFDLMAEGKLLWQCEKKMLTADKHNINR